ncbi:rod shape-determining protein MreC [Leptotrichia wadei]|jgi:rod shape-determining protein mreC|uniref:Cell shape-determining protein MreC n=1 Tax=Leptotrichia wadei TaxID=157687 RepID=A0A510KRV6_9FUSO|nr:rod shape-determining protein MreC [Leptotrichia wadei]MBS6018987.1 rod shape-determining protein MreC [Leptotrichia wadei]BBM54478.1 rod shape-determining protein MreC [Leptotrichia wadei]VTX78599.1 Cell shape-determining protein MreC [uncultured Leptotrichia sp.]
MDFSEKKGTGRTILIVIIIVIILFAFKNRITSSFTFLDGVTQAVNFRLVKVKSMLYTQVLKLKSRINDISYIEEYVENNKNRDFELQKNKVQNMEFAYLKEENEKLRQMLEMRQKNPSEFIAADVALVENGSSSEKMYINKGSAQGIKINLPVMFNGYLIGKISKVSDEYSEVTLLTSKTSKLSVVLNGTDQQILRGNGNGTFSILNYNEGKVDKNTVFNVETSGVSDILPRGIKIGTLKVTNLNDFNKMKEIRFKPSFNVFDIQSVLVYKWSVNDTINNQIQNQVKAEEEQQNKENSQTN